MKNWFYDKFITVGFDAVISLFVLSRGRIIILESATTPLFPVWKVDFGNATSKWVLKKVKQIAMLNNPFTGHI